jgi:hypothetical protein
MYNIVVIILSSILKDSKDCTDFEFGLYSENPPIPGYRRNLINIARGFMAKTGAKG